MVVSAQHFTDLTNGYEKTTSGLWTHRGRLQVLGGPVDLPDGSIGTAELAANAVQALLASYFGAVTWATPGAGAWYETAIQATATGSGGPLRIEASGAASNNTVGQGTYIGIGWGGTVQAGLLYFHAPAANSIVPWAFTYYLSSYTVGTPIRYAVFFLASAGVTTEWNGINSALWITEQKR